MYSTYFVSMITTIEKLFQIKSKTTGLLMSVTEVGQISTALFLTYYAGRGHRPRWIACGKQKKTKNKKRIAYDFELRWSQSISLHQKRIYELINACYFVVSPFRRSFGRYDGFRARHILLHTTTFYLRRWTVERKQCILWWQNKR